VDTDYAHVYTTDTEGALWAFDRRTGGALWKQDKLKSRRITRPTVVGSYVVVGDAEGYLHWVEAEDGRFVARQQVGGGDLVSAPVASDTRVYALSSSGKLEALEYQPKLTNIQ
jgi:outer membrane protein assembly factor BamB